MAEKDFHENLLIFLQNPQRKC